MRQRMGSTYRQSKMLPQMQDVQVEGEVMELLTNSRKSTYQECPRKFDLVFQRKYRPVKEPAPLKFGRLIHRALEMYYINTSMELIYNEINAMDASEYDKVSICELMRGYDIKWGRDLPVLAVEQQYEIPLINPDTMAASKTFTMAGKIDVVVGTKDDAANMEHKSTAEDIGPESNYWSKLNMDPQNVNYVIGAQGLGYNITKTIYDVIHKPYSKPAKETANKKYKKDGTLYANMRDADEAPEEYAVRLREHIAENPDRYYQRREIAYMEDDLVECLADMWAVGKQIMESRKFNRWPRRPAACHTYSECPFFPVCAKMDSLDSDRYMKIEEDNPELKETA